MCRPNWKGKFKKHKHIQNKRSVTTIKVMKRTHNFKNENKISDLSFTCIALGKKGQSQDGQQTLPLPSRNLCSNFLYLEFYYIFVPDCFFKNTWYKFGSSMQSYSANNWLKLWQKLWKVMEVQPVFMQVIDYIIFIAVSLD